MKFYNILIFDFKIDKDKKNIFTSICYLNCKIQFNLNLKNQITYSNQFRRIE